MSVLLSSKLRGCRWPIIQPSLKQDILMYFDTLGIVQGNRITLIAYNVPSCPVSQIEAQAFRKAIQYGVTAELNSSLS